MSRLDEKVAVIGLGYVGLPVAIAFSRVCDHVVGFDTSDRRVVSLRSSHDWTGEIPDDVLAGSSLKITSRTADLAGSTFFIVTVPTPIDAERRPDLSALRAASKTVGAHLTKGAVVVFESTVFPGATEEICGADLEAASGLTCGVDFTLGYSPERINPGDAEHRLETVVKVVSGQDAATLARISAAYSAIVPAGIFEAASIKVAEAAKVIENTQRDINIALMNELATIFERLGISTRDVLDAARTKWNFLDFTPGLVGGHCISVDPYYLTAKAEALGYHPQVILSGRRINDEMGRFVAQKVIKLMVKTGTSVSQARVGLLGLTFKENVPDLRNSRSKDIIEELQKFGIVPQLHDAQIGAAEVEQELGLKTCNLDDMEDLDALILAVPHEAYIAASSKLQALIRTGGVLADVKARFGTRHIRADIEYWSL